MRDVPNVLTYRDIETKLRELEVEHELLGRRYEDLTKQIRHQGKVKVDDHNAFLRNYMRNKP
jgi:hypothetical protein